MQDRRRLVTTDIKHFSSEAEAKAREIRRQELVVPVEEVDLQNVRDAEDMSV